MKQLTIVIPCYNEQEVIQESFDHLSELSANVEKQKGYHTRLLFVDDGSTDATWQIIERLNKEHHRLVSGVKLAANVGHQQALMAGLEHAVADSDIVLSIDADLQDDINVVPQMIDSCEAGCDIVYGVRRYRQSDTFFKRSTAQLFYRMMGRMGVKTVYNHADFRLMSRRAVEHLCQYRERNLFLRGIVPLLGFPTATVCYDRSPRTAGTTKYSLAKMVGLAVDGITSFSIRPVRMVMAMGLLFLLITLGILCYVLHAYIVGDTVPGWTSLMLSVWFVGACILIALGIVGEYVGKTYIEVKDRPRYHVEQTLGSNAVQRD
ncbi:MAG: glycosyltransferase family 2 protein [Prevotella sp.]|nr:glycosyltransferase family 2 protein [Prevotella sp.]MBQ6422829.1 glycosyltransferase family 2 protein [Prevotella sp.]